MTRHRHCHVHAYGMTAAMNLGAHILALGQWRSGVLHRSAGARSCVVVRSMRAGWEELHRLAGVRRALVVPVQLPWEGREAQSVGHHRSVHPAPVSSWAMAAPPRPLTSRLTASSVRQSTKSNRKVSSQCGVVRGRHTTGLDLAEVGPAGLGPPSTTCPLES